MTAQAASPATNPAAPPLVATTSPPAAATATVKPNHLRKGGTLFAVAVVAVLAVVAWTMWRQVGARKAEPIETPASATPAGFTDGAELYRRQLDEERGQRSPAEAATVEPAAPALPAAEQAAQQLLGQPMSVRAVRPLEDGQRTVSLPTTPRPVSAPVTSQEIDLDAQIKALEGRLGKGSGS